MMKRSLLLALFVFICGKVYLQNTTVAPKLNIPQAQLNAFQLDAEKKKKQFLNCILRISRNKDEEIRKQNMEDGIALFEDTAHVGVSNKNTKKVSKYSPRDYFYKVVSKYYNPFVPTIIDITSTPVVIDEVVKDESGNAVALKGHFEYTQTTTRCKTSTTQPNSDVPVYNDCYHDVTTKTGTITISPRPTSTGAGYFWVVLISGITVKLTE